ncbi:MAG: circularly permuted type 2 ATP-grasp protein [bacterium]|nr:circularly permuted type 2 ATP-grasp protein [bacterium]
MEHLVLSAPGEIVNRDGKMNTALVGKGFVDGKIATQSYLNMLYKNILQRKDHSLQGRVYMCDYRHLDIVDGCLFHKGERIHTLVELYRGMVPPEVMEVFKHGNIRLMNGPVSKLLANKLNLALLSDHEALGTFSPEEKDFIDRHVPWTRKVEPGRTTLAGKSVDLVDFILANREILVIKPGSGYGGKGVCVGRKATLQQWKISVKTALHEKDWAVQEFVESAPGLYQAGDHGYDIHDMSWGFFVFGPHYAGVWVRVLPRKGSKGVINCHQGASVSVVFNVDE